jgi:protein tyrosine phosphatase (PTP) superfamily phosphohydrolase (DUF442 family)
MVRRGAARAIRVSAAATKRRGVVLAACLLGCLVGGLVPDLAQGAPARLVAPNLVEISPRLVTSGQPTAAALARLHDLGFDAVIDLAPSTVEGAVRDEEAIVRGQGLAYVNIPIDFGRPRARDVDAFLAAMAGLRERKVLVHCQVNMRASSLVFLYRVIVLKEDPRVAYDAVTGVWAPHGAWRRLIESELRRHGVAFELL